MPTLEDVAALVSQLPEVTEGERRGSRAWSVRGKVFAWDRPFSKADLRRFGGETVPTEPVVGVRVADLHEKEAILATGRRGVFTIPHFDGYAAVLIELGVIARRDLEDVLVDGWLATAPEALADAFVKKRPLL